MRGKRREVAGYASVGEAIIALRRKGLSREEIGERIGVSADSVTNRINVMRRAGQWPEGLDTGATRKAAKSWTPANAFAREARNAVWVRRVARGDDPADVASDYGVMREDVARVCRAAGVLASSRRVKPAPLPVPAPVSAVTSHPTSGRAAGAIADVLGLSPAQADEAARLRHKGWSIAGLARRYDVPADRVAAAFNVVVGRSEG